MLQCPGIVYDPSGDGLFTVRHPIDIRPALFAAFAINQSD